MKATLTERFRSLRSNLGAFARENRALTTILLAGVLIHCVGITWGMPRSDGWDNDGVAPRDFLPGLAATFTPGHYYTYPPLHLAILGVLTLPFTLVALLGAPAFDQASLVATFIRVPTMTAFAVTARIVAIAMSVGIVFSISRIARRIVTPEKREATGILAALVATMHVPFTYYSYTSNLDVPYLFWGLLSLDRFIEAFDAPAGKKLGLAFIFAIFAVATKDQAYALFLYSYPIALAVKVWLTPKESRLREIWTIAKWGALAVAILLLVDGALTNPTGFRARLAFLSGPASQDFATYPKTAAGIAQLLKDLFLDFAPRALPRIAIIPFLLGLGVAGAAVARRRFVAILPLLVIVSFTLAFNCVARRVEDRFIMPQTLLASVYIAVGFDAFNRALFSKTRALGAVSLAATLAFFVFAIYPVLNIVVLTLRDPRYRAEAFLEENVKPNETIEVHGLSVYLPRFPKQAHVVRVGPASRRNPLPDVEEKVDALLNIDRRHPEWIVVVECYAWRFLRHDVEAILSVSTRQLPSAQAREFSADDQRLFFQRLYAGELDYSPAFAAVWPEGGFWKRIDTHSALGCPTRVFRRHPSE